MIFNNQQDDKDKKNAAKSNVAHALITKNKVHVIKDEYGTSVPIDEEFVNTFVNIGRRVEQCYTQIIDLSKNVKDDFQLQNEIISLLDLDEKQTKIVSETLRNIVTALMMYNKCDIYFHVDKDCDDQYRELCSLLKEALIIMKSAINSKIGAGLPQTPPIPDSNPNPQDLN